MAANGFDTTDPQTVRVLILDDVAVGRRVMSARVRQLGMQPLVAHDFQHAVQLIAQQRVDAIVTDLFLGDGMDPMETVEALRREAGAGTPILVVTSYPHAPEIKREVLARCNIKLLSSDAVPAIEVWLRAALNLPHHKMASGSTSSSADRDVMPWFIRAASIVGIVLGAMGAILISMMRGEWGLLRGFLQGLSP